MTDLTPSDFVVEEGQVRFYAAPLVTFTVRTPMAELYVVQVGFQKNDGSLRVQTPYFRHTDGIVTRVALEPDGSFPTTIDFLKNSATTSHHVKLSHKSDGYVHFSQDGKVHGDKILRSASFPLASKIGTIFRLHAFRPSSGFRAIDADDKKPGRLYLPFSTSESFPAGIRIEAKWRRKVDVSKWTSRDDRIIGPKQRLVHKDSGIERVHFFVGQPPGFPLRDHILDVYCDLVPVPDGVDDPMMILMGGYDSDEVDEPGDPAPPSECLAWWYPNPNPEVVGAVLESIDYTPERSANDDVSEEQDAEEE